MSRTRSTLRSAVAAAAAGAAAQVAFGWLQAHPPGGRLRWERINHAGRPVTLLEGPALATGMLAGVAAAPGVPGPLRAGAAVAVTGAACFGAVDDLNETGSSKGLRGHLGALARGRLTTGGLKILGIGATGLVAGGCALRASAEPPAGSAAGRALDLVGAGATVAVAANLVNLLDLRPGRALKVVLLHAPAVTGGPAGALVGASSGAAAALLPDDLAGRSMLGDTGANAAGALIGTAMVAGMTRRSRLAVLAGMVGLTLASEKVSFTKVIEATPGLREFDRLGRPRPAPARQAPPVA